MPSREDVSRGLVEHYSTRRRILVSLCSMIPPSRNLDSVTGSHISICFIATQGLFRLGTIQTTDQSSADGAMASKDCESYPLVSGNAWWTCSHLFLLTFPSEPAKSGSRFCNGGGQSTPVPLLGRSNLNGRWRFPRPIFRRSRQRPIKRR